MKKTDGIDDALGLDEPTLPTTIIMEPRGNYLTTTNPEDDFEYARRNIREVIDDVKEAVLTMSDVVKTSGSNKEAEALANLFDKFVTANERLVNIAKKPANPNGTEGAAQKVVNNTQNVVLVGSTNDMLKMMNRYRGEVDNEDDIEDERM